MGRARTITAYPSRFSQADGKRMQILAKYQLAPAWDQKRPQRLRRGTLGLRVGRRSRHNGFRPAYTSDLSTASYNLTADYLLDYGVTFGSGTATHHMTLHRAASGALVFGAGTVQYAWGLDSNHDNNFGFHPLLRLASTCSKLQSTCSWIRACSRHRFGGACFWRRNPPTPRHRCFRQLPRLPPDLTLSLNVSANRFRDSVGYRWRS